MSLPRVQPLCCVFVTHGFSVGGAEKVLLSLLESLDPSEFRTVVFSTGEGEELRQEYTSACARLVSSPRGCAFDFSLIPLLARTVFQEHADVVVSNLFYADIIAGMTEPLVRVPLISWQHAVPGTDRKNNRWYHRGAFRTVKNRFSRFVCCSGHLGHDLISLYGVRADRLTTIHNWVDTKRFRFHETSKTKARFKIGSVARFHAGKGHERLLRAFAKVVHEVRNAELILVGDGPTREEMQRMASALGLDGNTRFLGERNDVESILWEFDVFVLPSEAEAFPVSVLEAMSCGCPVVAFDIPGVRESVTPGRTGLLARDGDEDSLAECLVEVGRNAVLRDELSLSARAEVESRFERTKQTAKFVEILKTAARGR